MKWFCTIFLAFFFNRLPAQEVRLIKLDELEKRIESGRDSFYIINYWATWCLPCIKELPYFDRLQHEYKDQPVKVLLVSLDFLSQYKKSVIPFVKKKKLRSEVFLLNETDQQAYIDRISKQWSGALPATAFINRVKKTSYFFEQEFSYDTLIKTFNSLQ